MMENKYIDDFSQEFEDDLSLCNLPIQGYQDEEYSSHRPSTCSSQDIFEFSGGEGSSEPTTVLFCGKFLDPNQEPNEYQKRDYLSVKSASFHKPLSYYLEEESRSVSKTRSSSLRFAGPDPRKGSPVQKVNITAITSMSDKSRRRMFMFGPVKFKPEMDVASIRKRQGRRPPMQIPPLPEEAEKAVDGNGKRKKSGGDGELLRPLWCRSHIATALARSFGCISASMV
ncbi:hypothetical protein NMG60_11018625 [Bertholletia excelsa]